MCEREREEGRIISIFLIILANSVVKMYHINEDCVNYVPE